MNYLKTILFFLCVFIAFNVHAQSSNELKKQRDKLTEELNRLNHEYQETVNNKKATLQQLNILKKQIGVREEKIDNINSQVRALDNQITESNNTVHSLQNQLEQLKKEYAAMVLFAYRNQSAYNKLMFMFASKDFNQAYKRLKYLQQFGTYRERQASYIVGTEKDLNVKITELDKTKEEKHNLLLDQQKEKAALGEEKNNQLKVVADLSKHAGALKRQQQELQQRLAKNNRDIRAAIEREIEEARRKAEEEEKARLAAAARADNAARRDAAKNNTPIKESPRPVVKRATTTSEYLNATPEAAKLSSDFLENKGRLPWPVVNGNISHPFGTYVSQGIRMDNTGVDIKTNQGAAVRALFEGTVSLVTDAGGTFTIVIKHGEYFTAYSNLKSANVSKGQKVSTKQNIGSVYTDPSNGETEVHLDIYKDKVPVNPQIWLAER